MKPLLTISIPVYNRRSLLQRALDSIVCQMDERVEILISDNASDDGTQEMIRSEYPQVRYSRNEKNIGAEANFLKCLDLAQGKFVILFGSDDVLVDGALDKIINFLEKNINCSMVFMNHAFFSGDYVDISHCYKKWSDEFESLTTSNKNTFINYAKNQISFMSCLIFSKEAYETVEDPEKYIWTCFLHTNVALEFTKGKNTIFGIIGDICIADNTTPGEASIDNDPTIFFKIFGKGMYYTFCEHAVECGYDLRQMRKIYKKAIAKPFIYRIIILKALACPNWEKFFWKYGYPAVKHYLFLSTVIILTTFIPRWAADLIYKKIRPTFRKLLKRGKYI